VFVKSSCADYVDSVGWLGEDATTVAGHAEQALSAWRGICKRRIPASVTPTTKTSAVVGGSDALTVVLILGAIVQDAGGRHKCDVRQRP